LIESALGDAMLNDVGMATHFYFVADDSVTSADNDLQLDGTLRIGGCR